MSFLVSDKQRRSFLLTLRSFGVSVVNELGLCIENFVHRLALTVT